MSEPNEATSPGLTVTPYDRDYPAVLGRLIANLATLEFSLRVVLYLMDTARDMRRSSDWRFANLSVGDRMEESWLSQWCYLPELIGNYNQRQASLGLDPIDTGITDIRNAMAHGVITAEGNAKPLSCVKFGRPKGGSVTVEGKFALSFDWIGEQTDRVYRAGLSVNQRIQELR